MPYAHAPTVPPSPQAAPSEIELLTVRLFNGLTLAYWYGRDAVSLWSHLREMNLAERYPPTLELAHAYSEHAPAMGVISGFSRGLISGFRRGMAYARNPSRSASRLATCGGKASRCIIRGSCSTWNRGSPSALTRVAKRCGCSNGPVTTGRSIRPAIRSPPRSTIWATCGVRSRNASGITDPDWSWGTSRLRPSFWTCGRGGGGGDSEIGPGNAIGPRAERRAEHRAGPVGRGRATDRCGRD